MTVVDSCLAHPAALLAGEVSTGGGPTSSGQAHLEARLAVIEAALEAAPGRIRYRPLRRAIWRALLLTHHEVCWLRANPPATLPSLDLIALALVDRACCGNVKAGALLFDLVEGRPGRRREVGTSSTDGIGSETIEALVRLMYEHVSTPYRRVPARAGRCRH